MGRASGAVHALAITLQYIREKVQKHMLGRRRGSRAGSSITVLAYTLGDARPLGLLQGLVQPRCVPTLPFLLRFRGGKSTGVKPPHFGFWIRRQGEEIGLIGTEMGFNFILNNQLTQQKKTFQNQEREAFALGEF